MKTNLLLIEDETSQRIRLKRELERNDFKVYAPENLKELENIIRNDDDCVFSVVVFDVILEKWGRYSPRDMVNLLNEITEVWDNILLISISSYFMRDAEVFKEIISKGKATYYYLKGSISEHANKIKIAWDEYYADNVQSKTQQNAIINGSLYRDGKLYDFSYNVSEFKLTVGSESLEFTPAPGKILQYLLENQNQVLSIDQIAQALSSDPTAVQRQIQYINSNVMKKFEIKLIEAKRGIGYVIKS